ncbi:hypothetical protein HO133_003687 [Letharia lupina]|uniref:Uncharacterized protein n=1 Tax=Letharia lupina TaxID=560253 RepID=A0A8H6F943_9LECA|nr:uncharacterized protein HO133_003687 [Letharia lupina]KAF6219862.1 hypothetical protein HO133_003687 [Letharia lupina]
MAPLRALRSHRTSNLNSRSGASNVCSVIEEAADFRNTPASRGSSAGGSGDEGGEYEKDAGEEPADDLGVLDEDYGLSTDAMSSSASMSRCTSIDSMDHLDNTNRDSTVREIGGASMPLWTNNLVHASQSPAVTDRVMSSMFAYVELFQVY